MTSSSANHVPSPTGRWHRLREGILSVMAVIALCAITVNAVDLLSGPKERSVTLNAEGGASSTVRYELGEEEVTLERTPLPWSKAVRTTRAVDAIRVDVYSPGHESEPWCEIWIDGQLCDRKDNGRWCACYRKTKTKSWQWDSWSGTPNDKDELRTLIR